MPPLLARSWEQNSAAVWCAPCALLFDGRCALWCMCMRFALTACNCLICGFFAPCFLLVCRDELCLCSRLQCCHPLTGAPSPLLPGAHVTTETGSGLVHTAPGLVPMISLNVRVVTSHTDPAALRYCGF